MTPHELFRITCLKMMRVLTPHGHEDKMLPLLPEGTMSSPGGYFKLIKDDDKMPSTIWSSHLDVACSDSEAGKEVSFRFNGRHLSTDGKTILGADCKTGAAMMVAMATSGLPGMYIWHFGEERGGVGAKIITSDAKNEPVLKQFKHCIALDRRGYDSVITHQGGDETCSNEFATELAKRLKAHKGLDKFAPDRGGSYTDSKEYRGMVPECTNLSVGYHNQHRSHESQDLVFAENLLTALLDRSLTVDLPVRREPKIVRYLQQASYPAHDYRSRWNPKTGSWETLNKEDPKDGGHGNHVALQGVTNHGCSWSESCGDQSSGGVVRHGDSLKRYTPKEHRLRVPLSEMNSWPVLGTKRALSSVDFLARWKDTSCFIVGSGTADVMKERFTLDINPADADRLGWEQLCSGFFTNVLVYDPRANKLYINLSEVRYVKSMGWVTNKTREHSLESYPERDAAWQ